MKTKKQNKTHRLNFRVSSETFDKLEALSKILEMNNTKAFELSLDYILNSVLDMYEKKEIPSKNGKKTTTCIKG